MTFWPTAIVKTAEAGAEPPRKHGGAKESGAINLSVLLKIKWAYCCDNDRGMTLPLSSNLTMAVGQLGVLGFVFQGRCPWL